MKANTNSRNKKKRAGAWPAGDGEMARRIREFDWAGSPVGPMETWSPTLRMMVQFMLANRFPMLLWWGPRYIQFYNDPYRPIPGAKHPDRALGQPASECWAEIWNVIGPLIDRPFNGGPATWMEDILLEINRHGFTEETHFTIAYSPVPDETAPGGIGGVLATVHEISGKVVGERRVAVLRDLGATAAEAKTAEQACAVAAKTLEEHGNDIPFALLYLIDPDRKLARLAGTAGTAPGGPAGPMVVGLADDDADQSPWPLRDALRSEAVRTVTNLAGRLGTDVPPGPWSDPPHSALVLPIRSSRAHHLAGFLVAGVSSRLQLDEQYRSFLGLVTSQVATAIANARAYEEERRRAEALAEIDRAKTAFFSNVSHEFRTPLTLMLAPVEDLLLRSHTDLSPAAKGQLEIVNRNGMRLLRLVNTLLDFSRIEAGRVQAVYEPTDLASLTAELASVFRAATERAGLGLTLDCPRLPEPVYVDRDMWEKIVLNLVSNAFKFTFEGGIEVKIRTEASSVVLTVRDTGVGVPAEEMPRLFERFHRVRNMRSRTHEGSGIGLALVQELVKLHGGTIRAESRLGEGTSFIVSVPLGKEHLPPDRLGGTRTLASTAVGAAPYVEEALRWLPEADQIEEPARRALQYDLLPIPSPPAEEDNVAGRPRIIVADDNADMRQYLARLLTERYTVEAVPDGQAALAAARERRPDLVLSDVMMPNLDGFGLARELRADSALKTVPVILLSARAGEESRVEGLQQGADDYLIKPFGARELMARVATHLEMARLRREASEKLQESEERYRSLFEKLLEGFCIIEMVFDAENKPVDYRFLLINPAFEKQTGLHDAQGKLMRELAPNHEAHWFEIYGNVALTGEPARFVNEAKALNRWHDVSAYRVGGPDSRQVAILFNDITEAKRAEEALRGSEARLAAILEQLPEGVGLLDQGGQVILSNAALRAKLPTMMPSRDPERRQRWKAVDAQGRPIPPQQWPGARALRGETVSPGMEFVYTDEGGRELWMLVSAVPFRWDEVQGNGAIAVVQDITERKRAEEAVRASQATLQSFYDSAPFLMGIAELDGDKTVAVSGNHAVAAFFGTRPAQLPGQSGRGLGNPPDFERLWVEHYRRCLRDGQPVRFEYEHAHADGTMRWLSATVAFLGPGPTGNPRFSFVVENITERKRAEEALREAESILRSFFDAPGDMRGIVEVVAADDVRHIIDNTVTADFLGLTTEEMRNKLGSELGEPPDILRRWVTFYEESRRTEKPVTFEYRDTRATREAWLSATVSYLGTNPGGKPRFAYVVRDITERKRAEEALAAAHLQTQSLINNTTAIVYAFDREERFLLANTVLADLLNSTPGQMIGKRRHEFMPKEDADWHEANDRKVFEQEKPLEFEEHSQLKGRSITWLTTKFPLRDAQGRIYAVAGISADISGRKRAEEEIKQSQKTFSELIERSPFGTYIVDSRFRIAMMNAASQDGAFRNVRPVIGRDFSEAMRILWPEPVAADIIARFRHTLDTGEPYYSRDFINPRSDVTDVESYEWELHRMMLPDGQYGVICYYFDSTKLREAEEALRTREADLSEAQRLAHIGSWHWDAKTDSVIGSDELLRIYGFDPAAQTLPNFRDQRGRCYPVEDWERLNAAVQKTLDTGVGYELDLRAIRNGTTIWVTTRSAVVRDADGRIVGLRGTVQDITERRNAEEKLRAALLQAANEQKRLEAVIEALPIGVAILDDRGGNLRSNTIFEKIWHGPRPEVRSFDDYSTHKAWWLETNKAVEPHEWASAIAIQTGKVVIAQEMRIERFDGSSAFILNSAAPILDAEDRVSGCVVVIQDITERKRAEEDIKKLNEELKRNVDELAGANKELEAFTYSVSHDLRAPLRTILGFSHLLVDRHMDKFDEKGKKHLQWVLTSAEKMDRTIDDLLRLSRISRQEIQREAVDLSKVAGSVARELCGQQSNCRASIDIKQGITADADPRLMEVVFSNLLGNALKFTSKTADPRIEFGTMEQDGKTVYYVRDNGAGFDQSFADRLFLPFHRLHTEEEFEGTGIGLAIVERVIRGHGGKIWAEGAVNEGAAFFFTLH